MNRLSAELRRLYLPSSPSPAPAAAEATNLFTPEGRTRTLVLALARPADWQALSAVWQGVQIDLALPAPAVAVSGSDAYQLWFSLAEPVPLARATAFLDALRRRYLGEIAPQRITMLPAEDPLAPEPPQHARLVPAQQAPSGHWSAFVSPDLAPMFEDDPWLDLAPSTDAQADLLSRLTSMAPADFEQALQQLAPAAIQPVPHASAGANEAPVVAERPLDTLTTSPLPALDPRRFLLQVMNDPAVALHLRIEAAKALLPFTEDRRR